MKEYMVYDTGKQKMICAGVVDNNIFIKAVDFRKHFMRNYGGYAISLDVLNKLKEDGINLIRIDEGENIYATSVESCFAKGISFDVGYGKQVCLDLKFMRKSDQKQELLFGK